MSTQSTQLSYTVHLEPAVAESLGVDSPVETDHIDYYDSGLWVTTPAGRDFYPYRHVLAIRERPVPPTTASEERPESAVAEPPGEAQD